MMILLVKRFPSANPFPCLIHRSTAPSNLLQICFFSPSAARKPAGGGGSFVVQYLISTFGFSPQKAATASKSLSRFTSAETPDSVRHFLKHHGFADSDVRAIVSSEARVLSTSLANVLEPNLQALRGTGYFSDPELRRLIVYHPRILTHPRPIPRLEYWKDFLGGDTKKLHLVFVRNPGLICQDIHTGIAPKISLLKKYGLSEVNIAMVLLKGPGIFRRSVASMKALLERVEELGFRRGSTLFVRAFVSLCCVSPDMFKAKMEMFKGYGWSEEDFLTALRKEPHMVRLSVENVGKKMEFLVGKAGCDQSYIASRPALLAFSLEKRLVPRYHVMNVLKASGVVCSKASLSTLMLLSEKDFVEKIVSPYLARVPKLHETYLAACCGEVPI